MDPLVKVTGKVVPLPVKDVDTDMIIPAQYLTSISREGFGNFLFKRLRDADPNFPLNLPQYKSAPILVADANFGCGSSREHAVWALKDAGIKVIIAPSFADIFFNNSAKNGLLLIKAPHEYVASLLREAARGEVILDVDLDAQEIRRDGIPSLPFTYDPFRRYCIMNGLDDLDYVLSHKEEIQEYFKTKSRLFFRSPAKTL